MRWSFGIGSIAGTSIRVHITFALFLVWIVAANWAAGGADQAWTALVFMVALFACVVAHEFGHILTARRFGIRTPDVTLLPIGGVARLERIPEQPAQEFLIAIAGPLVNVAIALVLIAFGADLTAQSLADVDTSKLTLVDRLAAINLFLALFNMIPAFPMDGGRVLRALLGIKLGHLRATEIAATIGQWVAFAFGFIGLFSNPMLIFIAIFVYLAAAAESQGVALRGVSQGVPVRAAMMTQFATLKPDDRIDSAIETMFRTSQSEFPVVDEAGRFVGLLGRNEMIRALKDLGPQAVVSEVMATGVATINHRCFLDEAFRVLQESSSQAVGIIDSEQRLVGLVTSETLGEMLMVQGALPKGAAFGPWNLPAKA